MTGLTDLGDQLLAGMLTYGYPVLGLTLLLGAVGVPVPASLVATVAGTMLAEGELGVWPAVLVALAASLAGDLVGYGIGRFGGHQFARRHGRWIGMGAQRLSQVEALFRRWAAPTLLLSRSLIAIGAPAVNLLAGASDQKLRTFLVYDALGRLVWIGMFMGLGYAFAGSAEIAADFASSLSGVVGLVGLVCLLAVAARRGVRPAQPDDVAHRKIRRRMLIDHRVTVPAPPERVWAFMMDIPAVSRCVPGLDNVARIDDQTYTGVMSVRVGPIAVKLDGRVLLAERDEAAHAARMDLEAADKRVNGAVNARMRMQLAAVDGGSQTDLAIHTDANVMGKLGEFGQAVIRKKADQLLQEFARNLSAAVTAGGS